MLSRHSDKNPDGGYFHLAYKMYCALLPAIHIILH